MKDEHYAVVKKYLWPWILLPFALIYVADFVTAIIFIVQLFCVFSLIVLGIGLFWGAYLAMYESFKKEKIIWYRLFSVLPTILWGYKLCKYLLEDEGATK